MSTSSGSAVARLQPEVQGECWSQGAGGTGAGYFPGGLSRPAQLHIGALGVTHGRRAGLLAPGKQ